MSANPNVFLGVKRSFKCSTAAKPADDGVKPCGRSDTSGARAPTCRDSPARQQINDRGDDDPAVSSRSDHALLSAQTGDPVPAVHQPGSVELLLPHGRGEDHREVQPGRGQDGEGESGRDDAERAVRRAGRPGRGVLQDMGVQEQQRGGVLHPRPAGSHGGQVRRAHGRREQEPPVYFWDF